MTIDVDAVYENGVLRLKQPVDLPEHAEVHVTIQTDAEARTPLGRRLRQLRAEITKSGAPALDWDEIETESRFGVAGGAKDRDADVRGCRRSDCRCARRQRPSGSRHGDPR